MTRILVMLLFLATPAWAVDSIILDDSGSGMGYIIQPDPTLQLYGDTHGGSGYVITPTPNQGGPAFYRFNDGDGNVRSGAILSPQPILPQSSQSPWQQQLTPLLRPQQPVAPIGRR